MGKEKLYIRALTEDSRFSSTNMAVVERGQRYKIVNAKSGTVLDLSSSNQEFGRHPPPSSTYTALTTCLSLVNGWNFHGRDNQIVS
jgi:hypothetical protein